MPRSFASSAHSASGSSAESAAARALRDRAKRWMNSHHNTNSNNTNSSSNSNVGTGTNKNDNNKANANTSQAPLTTRSDVGVRAGAGIGIGSRAGSSSGGMPNHGNGNSTGSDDSSPSNTSNSNSSQQENEASRHSQIQSQGHAMSSRTGSQSNASHARSQSTQSQSTQSQSQSSIKLRWKQHKAQKRQPHRVTVDVAVDAIVEPVGERSSSSNSTSHITSTSLTNQYQPRSRSGRARPRPETPLVLSQEQDHTDNENTNSGEDNRHRLDADPRLVDTSMSSWDEIARETNTHTHTRDSASVSPRGSQTRASSVIHHGRNAHAESRSRVREEPFGRTEEAHDTNVTPYPSHAKPHIQLQLTQTQTTTTTTSTNTHTPTAASSVVSGGGASDVGGITARFLKAGPASRPGSRAGGSVVGTSTSRASARAGSAVGTGVPKSMTHASNRKTNSTKSPPRILHVDPTATMKVERPVAQRLHGNGNGNSQFAPAGGGQVTETDRGDEDGNVNEVNVDVNEAANAPPVQAPRAAKGRVSALAKKFASRTNSDGNGKNNGAPSFGGTDRNGHNANVNVAAAKANAKATNSNVNQTGVSQSTLSRHNVGANANANAWPGTVARSNASSDNALAAALVRSSRSSSANINVNPHGGRRRRTSPVQRTPSRTNMMDRLEVDDFLEEQSAYTPPRNAEAHVEEEPQPAPPAQPPAPLNKKAKSHGNELRNRFKAKALGMKKNLMTSTSRGIINMKDHTQEKQEGDGGAHVMPVKVPDVLQEHQNDGDGRAHVPVNVKVPVPVTEVVLQEKHSNATPSPLTMTGYEPERNKSRFGRRAISPVQQRLFGNHPNGDAHAQDAHKNNNEYSLDADATPQTLTLQTMFPTSLRTQRRDADAHQDEEDHEGSGSGSGAAFAPRVGPLKSDLQLRECTVSPVGSSISSLATPRPFASSLLKKVAYNVELLDRYANYNVNANHDADNANPEDHAMPCYAGIDLSASQERMVSSGRSLDKFSRGQVLSPLSQQGPAPSRHLQHSNPKAHASARHDNGCLTSPFDKTTHPAMAQSMANVNANASGQLLSPLSQQGPAPSRHLQQPRPHAHASARHANGCLTSPFDKTTTAAMAHSQSRAHPKQKQRAVPRLQPKPQAQAHASARHANGCLASPFDKQGNGNSHAHTKATPPPRQARAQPQARHANGCLTSPFEKDENAQARAQPRPQAKPQARHANGFLTSPFGKNGNAQAKPQPEQQTVRLSASLLAQRDHEHPAPRLVNGMNVQGFAGFFNKTEALPNLADDVSMMAEEEEEEHDYDELDEQEDDLDDPYQENDEHGHGGSLEEQEEENGHGSEFGSEVGDFGSDVFDGVGSLPKEDEHEEIAGVEKPLASTTLDTATDNDNGWRQTSIMMETSQELYALPEVTAVSPAEPDGWVSFDQQLKLNKTRNMTMALSNKNHARTRLDTPPSATTSQSQDDSNDSSFGTPGLNAHDYEVTDHGPKSSALTRTAQLFDAQAGNRARSEVGGGADSDFSSAIVLPSRSQSAVRQLFQARRENEHGLEVDDEEQDSFEQEQHDDGFEEEHAHEYEASGSCEDHDNGEDYYEQDDHDHDEYDYDLAQYYISPDVARLLVRQYRKLCDAVQAKAASLGDNDFMQRCDDSKKGFALSEMRSRIMETDMERGSARRGGTRVEDDLVLTTTNLAALRVRDASVVSKAWRDGASPQDVWTAHLLTRRSTHTHYIKRPLYSSDGSYDENFGEASGVENVTFYWEEVGWMDDLTLEQVKCGGSGGHGHGLHMFTMGDCQSMLLKLTNEHVQLCEDDLLYALDYQKECEELMRVNQDEDADTDGSMSESEHQLLSAMDETAYLTDKRDKAVRAFGSVKLRITSMISRYETMLVKINEEEEEEEFDEEGEHEEFEEEQDFEEEEEQYFEDAVANTNHAREAALQAKAFVEQEQREYMLEQDRVRQELAHAQEQAQLELQHRATAAEERAMMASKEAREAKAQAERFRVEKETQVEELQRKLAAMEMAAKQQMEEARSEVLSYKQQVHELVEQQSAVGIGISTRSSYSGSKSANGHASPLDEAARSVLSQTPSPQEFKKIQSIKERFRQRSNVNDVSNANGRNSSTSPSGGMLTPVPASNGHAQGRRSSQRRSSPSPSPNTPASAHSRRTPRRSPSPSVRMQQQEQMVQHLDFYERSLKSIQ
jgi:hypothetical protein